MSEQTDTTETTEQTETPPANPLWLPRGSVRALIALGVVGVWIALETGATGLEPSDAVRSIAVAIAAGYGLLRSRDQKIGGSE